MAVHLGIAPLLLREAIICVVLSCLGTSIVCHLAMQKASPMGALETGSAWEDAAGTRNDFAWFNALH